MDFATLNSQEIIEISTFSGGLTPYTTNYYFVIYPKSKRVVPKKLFKDKNKLSSEIISAVVLDPEHGQPELQVLHAHKLARSFRVYDYVFGKNQDNEERKLSKVVYRWNGRFYAPIPTLKR
jgi:hypothetical protein